MFAPIANLVFSLRIFLAILSVPDVKIFTRIAISARFLNAFPAKAVSILTLHSNVKNVYKGVHSVQIHQHAPPVSLVTILTPAISARLATSSIIVFGV